MSGPRPRGLGAGFWRLFAALALQNVVVLAVSMVDSIMLGGYSEVALAGAAIVNQIQYLLYSIVGEVGAGLVVLGSQYWGRRNQGPAAAVRPVKKLTAAAVAAGLLVALVFLVVTSAAPMPVLRLFTRDGALLAAGYEYLRVLRFSFPFFALSTVLLAMLRSVETVRLALVVSAGTLCANGFLNWLFIYGGLGLPQMGAAGAARATVLARAGECAVICLYVFFGDKKLRLRPKDLFAPSAALARDYARATAPMLLNGVLWGVAVALQTVILGHMSSAAIAANSIAVNCTMVLKVLAVAMASASAVLIGQTVGAGNLPGVRAYTRRLQGAYVVLGLCVCAVVLLITRPMLALYTISEETRRLATSFFVILAFTSAASAYQVPVLTGILMGGGDTRFNTVNNIVCIWFIMLPLSFLGAFVWHWPPQAVVLCLNADQVYKCIPAVIKVNRFRWIKNLTRQNAG